MTIKIKEPSVIKNVFDIKDFYELMAHCRQGLDSENASFDFQKSRWLFNDDKLQEYGNKLLPLAREIFESDTLLVSNTLFAHYFDKAKLPKHLDNNACTYSLDLCIYQNEPWDIGVTHNDKDKFYTLMPNEALAFYGNDQQHWRPSFPNPSSNKVGMIFFHFVEPDHWFFTKGKEYVYVLSNSMTEEQWKEKYKKD
jgi:hypothetical protein